MSFLQNAKRKREKGIPPSLPRKKVTATTPPVIADATAPPETAAAAVSKKEAKTSLDKELLIDSHLATPP